MTALLSQEGSVIAKQSREGWFPSGATAGFRIGTTPALRATPPDSGGEPRPHKLNSAALALATMRRQAHPSPATRSESGSTHEPLP